MGLWRNLTGGQGGPISGWICGTISPVNKVGRSVGGFVALDLELDRRTMGWRTVGHQTGARSVEVHRLACLALWSLVTTTLECVCEECLECDCEKHRRGVIDLKVK